MSNEKGTLSIEEQGIDTISEEERKGTPASLFWPWFAANVSMFAMSYGAWALGFGISFWQATAMTIIGVVISFLLVGIISIAGKRGNAPTMVLTRATFGVEGAKVPAALSWIATLGWEISLTTTLCWHYQAPSKNSVGALVSRPRSSPPLWWSALWWSQVFSDTT